MPLSRKKTVSSLLILSAFLASPAAQAGFFDDIFNPDNWHAPRNPWQSQPSDNTDQEPAPVVMGKPKPVIVGPFSSVANAASLADLIRNSLADGKGSLKIGRQYVVKEIAARVYSLHQFQPLFVNEAGLTPVGEMMVKILAQESLNKGLSPSFYWSQEAAARVNMRDVKSLGELDLLLAINYLQYANDVATGRTNPQDATQNLTDIEYKKRSFNNYQLLNDILSSPAALYAGLQSLEPKHPVYQKMVQAMTRLQTAKRAGGWPRLINERKALKLGVSSKNVPAIRARLFDLGMLADGADRNDPALVYDEALETGVRNLQEGAKKATDGIVGPGTLNLLNVSIDSRIRQLQVNLERWRLMPPDLGPNHIFVDLGRQHLTLVQNGQETLSFRTVVGMTVRQTPSFPDEIGYLLVNPFWTAPGSIVVKDILPNAMQDPGYFTQLNMKILDDNGRELDPYSFSPDYWSQFDLHHLPPYTFREEPGPNNSLGRVKFQLMRNKHDIYLHDTNHHELFANLSRLNSSGCIRLERPVDLAEKLLANQGIDKNRINQMIDDPTVRAQKVPLQGGRMPVYVMGTTIALSGGSLLFGPDIYGQDKRILDALNGLRIVPTERTFNFFGDRDTTL